MDETALGMNGHNGHPAVDHEPVNHSVKGANVTHRYPSSASRKLTHCNHNIIPLEARFTQKNAVAKPMPSKDPYVHPITFLYRVMRDPTAAIEGRVKAAVAILEIEHVTAQPKRRRA